MHSTRYHTIPVSRDDNRPINHYAVFIAFVLSILYYPPNKSRLLLFSSKYTFLKVNIIRLIVKFLLLLNLTHISLEQFEKQEVSDPLYIHVWKDSSIGDIIDQIMQYDFKIRTNDYKLHILIVFRSVRFVSLFLISHHLNQRFSNKSCWRILFKSHTERAS